MRIEFGLQSNHSDYMRLVATLSDGKSAQRVYEEFLRYLEELFTRGDRFMCSGFGRGFKTRKKFRAWKKKEWDPIADESCKLSVEKRNGRIWVSGNYGLILDDWSREDTAVALDGSVIALSVYTAGYGLEHLEEWLSKRGASTQITVQGEEYAYQRIDDALAEIDAQAGKKRPGGVRTAHSDDASVRPGGNLNPSAAGNPV